MPGIGTQVDVMVGARVKARRQELRLSRQHLAAVLDVSARQIERYEAGAERIGSARLAKVAELFDVPVRSFFMDESEADPAGSALSLVDVSGAIALLRAFASLDPEMRNVARTVVESLAQRSGHGEDDGSGTGSA